MKINFLEEDLSSAKKLLPVLKIETKNLDTKQPRDDSFERLPLLSQKLP